MPAERSSGSAAMRAPVTSSRVESQASRISEAGSMCRKKLPVVGFEAVAGEAPNPVGWFFFFFFVPSTVGVREVVGIACSGFVLLLSERHSQVCARAACVL